MLRVYKSMTQMDVSHLVPVRPAATANQHPVQLLSGNTRWH